MKSPAKAAQRLPMPAKAARRPSMHARSRLVLGVAGAAAVGAIGFFATRAPTPEPLPAPTPARASDPLSGCHFVAGQRLAFDLAMDLSLEIHAAAMAPADPAVASQVETVTTTTRSDLQASVLAVTTAGEAIIALRPQAWRDTPDAIAATGAAWAKDLSRTYLVRLDARCHVLASARHQGASLLAYDRVVRLIDALDFATPERASDHTAPYVTRHTDTNGVYLMGNTFVAGAGRGIIQRRRTRFLSTVPAGPDQPELSLSIRSSTGHIALGDGPWLASLDEREALVASYDGRTALATTTHTHVAAAAIDGDAFADQDLVLSHYVWGRPDAAELRAARDGQGDEALRAITAEAAWRAYQTDAGHDWFGAQKRLRAWLRANPEGVAAIAAGLRAGRYSEAEQAALVLAFAKSGSVAARRALEQLASDATLGENLRTQAVSALGDLVAPDGDTIATLTRLADRAGGASQQDMVGSAATLTLGTLIAEHPTVADPARAYLDARLAVVSSDTKGVTEALWAVGNSGDDGFLELVEPLAVHSDPDLRAAAAHALRKMPSAEAGPILARGIRSEAHPEVAAEIAAARREQLGRDAQLSAQELNLYRSKLLDAPEPLRRELVLVLGAASRHQPEAREILAAWFPNETSLAVKQLIGQFVPASLL